MFSFDPPPQLESHPYAFWTDGFTEEELAAIDVYCSSLDTNKGLVGIQDGREDASYRECDISWLEWDNNVDWIFQKLGFIARHLNQQYFRFDITGAAEPLQYTVYKSDSEGHYDWHVDVGDTETPRKLTLVLQLSDPSGYEGGELYVKTGKEDILVEQKKGLVVAFPGYTLHKVTPVTEGVRKTLVMWTTGPEFR